MLSSNNASPSADALDPAYQLSPMPEDIENVRSWVEATESGDISVLEQLLDAGFDTDYKVDFPKPGEILEDWNGAPAVVLEIGLAWDGVPGIVHAAKWGQISAVRFLLERGADVDNVNDTACNIGSALLKASEAGHLEMVKLLLARGAKTDAVKVFQGTTTPLVAVAGLSLSTGSERTAPRNHRFVTRCWKRYKCRRRQFQKPH